MNQKRDAGDGGKLRVWRLKNERAQDDRIRYKGVYEDTGEVVPGREGELDPSKIDHELAGWAAAVAELNATAGEYEDPPIPRRVQGPSAGGGLWYLIDKLVDRAAHAARLDPLTDDTGPLFKEAPAADPSRAASTSVP